jgi:hypothetical protein
VTDASCARNTYIGGPAKKLARLDAVTIGSQPILLVVEPLPVQETATQASSDGAGRGFVLLERDSTSAKGRDP